MGINRREFLVTPAAALAGSLFGASDIPWQRKIRRLGQLNMTEHDPVVLNVEEGGEHSILHGDRHSEYHLSETPTEPLMGTRNLIIESFYEYGSRAGQNVEKVEGASGGQVGHRPEPLDR